MMKLSTAAISQLDESKKVSGTCFRRISSGGSGWNQ